MKTEAGRVAARTQRAGAGEALDRIARDAVGRPAEGADILVGLIGESIARSLSPRMHEAEAARLGLSYVYRLIDTNGLGRDPRLLPSLIDAAEQAGFRGLNITHPYKQAAVAEVDDLSVEAAEIGAINTIVFDGGRRIGHNTDCWGFAEAFRRGLPDAPLDSVLLLGAGGAGVAVARALVALGVRRLAVYDIDRAKATALAEAVARAAEHCRAEAAARVEDVIGRVDGIVNATPIGMAGHEGIPLDPAVLRPTHWVADIVYFPLTTTLLRAAREAGCRTLQGAGMAAHQAARAFALFSGATADPTRMQALIEG